MWKEKNLSRGIALPKGRFRCTGMCEEPGAWMADKNVDELRGTREDEDYRDVFLFPRSGPSFDES